jgi:type II secretory pathway pseudopilin PulG
MLNRPPNPKRDASLPVHLPSESFMLRPFRLNQVFGGGALGHRALHSEGARSRATAIKLGWHLWQTSHRRSAPTPGQAPGLTLIESLVAIIVIAITVAAITPPIFVATATRIQTRRAEQARAIAQGEVDRVRALMERGVTDINLLPGVPGTAPASPQALPAAQLSVLTTPMLSPVACPTGIARYPAATPVASDRLTPVDVNGDCQPDYAMQVFRLPSAIPTGGTVPFSFTMGVRVYAYRATYASLSVQQSSLGLTTGRRDSGPQQRPLAVLYSQISRNDSSRSLGQICRQAGGTEAACLNRD